MDREELPTMEPVALADADRIGVIATEDDLSVDQRTLIGSLCERGGRAKRLGLPRISRWRRDRYLAVRHSLEAAGWITYDRYGVLALAPDEGRRIPVPSLPTLANERELEPYAQQVVHSMATTRFGLAEEDFRIENTARGGSAPTGGKWTRPDISLLSVETHPWFPDVNLMTFEVKLGTQLRVDAVHEALAHRAKANAAWIVTDARCTIDETRFDRIIREARTHGIGVVVIDALARNGEVAEEDTHYHVHAEAAAHKPEPETINDFLEQQFPAALRNWLRLAISRALLES
ncbi:MAG: hypothetical protein R2755_23520 [Acidimicrobiales bacterium]